MAVRNSGSALAAATLALISAPAVSQEVPVSDVVAADAPAPASETTSSAAGEEVELALLDTSRISTRGPAIPQKAKDGPIELSFNAAGISDYRYRGISLTNGKPAMQAELGLEHESGLFATAWASSLAGGNGYGHLELDATLGFAKEVGDLALEGGVTGFFYPGVSAVSYFELQGGISTSFGDAELSLNLAYAPKQANIGGQDNVYGSVALDMPLKNTPLSFNGSIGLENGAFGDRKVDWSLGAVYTVMGVDLGVTYVDTARAAGAAYSGPRALFSLGRKF